MKELIAKRNELKAKQEALGKIFEEAGPELDMSKIKLLDGSAVEKVERIRQLNDELNAIGMEVEKLAGIEKSLADQKRRSAELGSQNAQTFDQPEGQKDQKRIITLGELFCKSDVYANRKHPGVQQSLPEFEMKTLFETGAGWAPESLRTGRIVDAVARPIRVIDIMPAGTTNQAAVVYMEETTLTLNAQEKAEGVAYAESAFGLTERSVTVQKITASVPVTDEQLDDVAQVQGYLDRRLRYDLMQRLDYQILNGTGVSPLLQGVGNKSGIQTQAKGADPVPDAVRKAITKVRVTGRAEPNVVIMHPNDWQDVTLLRTNDGQYIWGNPSGVVVTRIWGLPVVETDAQTENTGVVGDFANFAELVNRKGIDVQIGFVNDDFSKGKKTIRADFRIAIIWYRAAAFCTVTGI